MKIIVSHDVDHLFRGDHYKDLIYPKLWVRSSLELLKGEYGISEWAHRMCNPFLRVRHRIEEVMMFDREHAIPSSFFFGMDKGLGMSYTQEKASDVIRYVDKEGFDVGVHGISYTDEEKMQKEYDDFARIIGRKDFGIRMHYVRFDENTFSKLDRCGYLFDTTCFNKMYRDECLNNPYKLNSMWEFPLNIMDGYLPKKIAEKKAETVRLIEKAEREGLQYLTLLFHDYQFCKGYATEKEWYIWTINYLKEKGYNFISYRDAIAELEEKEI